MILNVSLWVYFMCLRLLHEVICEHVSILYTPNYSISFRSTEKRYCPHLFASTSCCSVLFLTMMAAILVLGCKMSVDHPPTLLSLFYSTLEPCDILFFCCHLCLAQPVTQDHVYSVFEKRWACRQTSSPVLPVTPYMEPYYISTSALIISFDGKLGSSSTTALQVDTGLSSLSSFLQNILG